MESVELQESGALESDLQTVPAYSTALVRVVGRVEGFRDVTLQDVVDADQLHRAIPGWLTVNGEGKPRHAPLSLAQAHGLMRAVIVGVLICDEDGDSPDEGVAIEVKVVRMGGILLEDGITQQDLDEVSRQAALYKGGWPPGMWDKGQLPSEHLPDVAIYGEYLSDEVEDVTVIPPSTRGLYWLAIPEGSASLLTDVELKQYVANSESIRRLVQLLPMYTGPVLYSLLQNWERVDHPSPTTTC